MIFTKDFILMSQEALYASRIWRTNSTKFPNEVGETVGTSKKKTQQLVRPLRLEINQEDLNILKKKKKASNWEKNHNKEREILFTP